MTCFSTTVCLLALLVGAAPDGATDGVWIKAISRPNTDVTLSFSRPGVIERAEVKEGDRVRPDDLLVKLDDSAEMAQLEQLRAQAEDTTKVEAAKARWDQAKVDYENIKQAYEGGGANKTEVEHARLEMDIARLSHRLAEFQQAQDKRKLKEAALQLQRMRLRSRTAGIVQEIFLRKGESADAFQKVIRVVNIDPLWVDVPVPQEMASKLEAHRAASDGSGEPGENQKALVRFDRQSDPVPGVIVFKSLVADSASETLRVRVEFANPDLRPAGERVDVRFPAAE